MNVLVIEDDKRIAALVERALIEAGHGVSLCHNGREGAEMLLKGKYEAALLDVLLPGMDGFEVLEMARTRHCRTPILMLTAVDSVPKIVEAFDLGVDDYIVKPFILEILLARVAAIARRGKPSQETNLVSAGGITLDRGRRIASYEGRAAPLTKKQFELLEMLMRRADLITSREDLMEAAWGYVSEDKKNALDVYIHGLRTKLDELTQVELKTDSNKPMIRTVHGEGYMFVAV
ncbi:MAG: response regulator transcription factor [Edaphobacter sp.]|uniref:response regulator transcription factor n=1 Tax=Edaphobacter sp. TaxID=1934404 RepID=UPI00238B388F|nr:response regulator transcription factor [Edaphobacter sp.]MDE1178264.1 response regulator transcription factor [Edaphobacter sp.]